MINFDYKNKVAVVTGGTSGIGLATVRILLKSGAKVAFCARSRERLLEVESKLKLEFSNDQVFAKALSVLDQNEVNKFSKDVLFSNSSGSTYIGDSRELTSIASDFLKNLLNVFRISSK